MRDADLFERLCLRSERLESGDLEVRSPIDGSVMVRLRQTPIEWSAPIEWSSINASA